MRQPYFVCGFTAIAVNILSQEPIKLTATTWETEDLSKDLSIYHVGKTWLQSKSEADMMVVEV